MTVHMPNHYPPMVDEAISIMRNYDADFYLTGSRYFGTTVEGSDWDFFVEDSQGVLDYLQNNGFRIVERGESGYGESADTSVILNYKDVVHVQLVINAKRKYWIQEKLNRYAPFRFMEKEHRTIIWKIALEFAPLTEAEIAKSLTVHRKVHYPSVNDGKS